MVAPLEDASCVGCGDTFQRRNNQVRYCSIECREKTRSARDYAKLKAKAGTALDIPNEQQDALARNFDVRHALGMLTDRRIANACENVMQAVGNDSPPSNQDLMRFLLGIHLQRIGKVVDKELRYSTISQKVTSALREVRLTINDLELYGKEKPGDVNVNTLILNALDPTRLQHIRDTVQQGDADRGDVPMAGEPITVVPVSDEVPGGPDPIPGG